MLISRFDLGEEVRASFLVTVCQFGRQLQVKFRCRCLNFEQYTMKFQIIFCVILSCLVTTMADDTAVAVSRGNGLFANKLYQILSKEPGNIFFSPISAHAVLSLAYQGAEGQTAESFKTALNIPLAQETAKGYKNIMSALNTVENVTLHIANKVFVQNNYKLKDSFKSVATDYFLSEAENINFGNNDAAAKTINTWVEDKTKNKIKDLISPDDLNDLTRLVLVNAIYFKGNWADQFNPRYTHAEPFWISATESVECQMMHITKHFNYAESAELDAKILQLPYTNRDLSLVIILPNARDGIKQLEAKLANVDLTTLTRETRDEEVQLSLPKFKIETTIPLNDPLKQLGLERIFSDNAEFPNMIDSPEPLKVSKVIQKAFIEVNEEGAEAAAATGIVMVAESASFFEGKSYEVIADHPFIFFILDRVEGRRAELLFQGRIDQPTY